MGSLTRARRRREKAADRPEVSSPELRPLDEKLQRRGQQLEELVRTHKPPKMIEGEDGKEYRPEDPEFADLEIQDTELKALIKGEEIYGRELTELEFMTLYLALHSGTMPAEVGAAMGELSKKGLVPELGHSPGLLARFHKRFAEDRKRGLY